MLVEDVVALSDLLYKWCPPAILYVSTLRIGIPSIIIALYLLTTSYALRFDPNVAHAAHDMVSGLLAVFQGYYFNRVRGIVGTHDQVAFCSFDVPDDASAVFRYGVYMLLSLLRYGVSEL